MSAPRASPRLRSHDREQSPQSSTPSPLGELVRGLSALLTEAGIEHGFLRGHRELPRLRPGGDVDMALRAGDLAAFEQVLESCLTTHGARVRARFRAPGLRQFHLHARGDDGRHHFLDLDVHLSETCYGVSFLQARDLLAGPRPAGELPELAPHASAWVDLLGAHLVGGQVAERYRHTLAERRDEPGVRELGRRLFGAHRCEQLLEAVHDPEALAARAHGDRRALLRRCIARRPLASTLGVLGMIWSRRVRPYWRPRGLTVAFLGTDGAGKTTLLDEVMARLGPAFRSADNGILKLRPGLLPQLDRLVHFGRSTQGPTDWARPHRAQPSGRLVSNLRVLYYSVDYVVGHVLRVLPRRCSNSLLIFDRWFDDVEIDSRRFRVRAGTAATRIMARFLPQPDAVIIVTADLERIQARKQELTVEESARQIAAYEVLAGRGGRYHLVRNDRTIEEGVQAILDALFLEEGSR